MQIGGETHLSLSLSLSLSRRRRRRHAPHSLSRRRDRRSLSSRSKQEWREKGLWLPSLPPPPPPTTILPFFLRGTNLAPPSPQLPPSPGRPQAAAASGTNIIRSPHRPTSATHSQSQSGAPRDLDSEGSEGAQKKIKGSPCR